MLLKLKLVRYKSAFTKLFGTSELENAYLCVIMVSGSKLLIVYMLVSHLRRIGENICKAVCLTSRVVE